MSIPFAVHSLTVLRPATRVELGSVYEDWSAPPVPHVVDGCHIQGGDTREDHVRADAQIAQFTVWAPIGADVTGHDRVAFTYAGRAYTDYEVDGDPVPLEHGDQSHLLLHLSKREDR